LYFSSPGRRWPRSGRMRGDSDQAGNAVARSIVVARQQSKGAGGDVKKPRVTLPLMARGLTKCSLGHLTHASPPSRNASLSVILGLDPRTHGKGVLTSPSTQRDPAKYQGKKLY
jgi:hypothetical protein